MPRLNSEITDQIKALSFDELQEIVLKFSAKEQSFFDFLFVNYIDKESGEKDLYEKTIRDLEVIFRKSYKGFSQQLQLANMLSACIKRINEFTGISKNKVLEANLLIHILEVPFSLTTKMFGTCFTQYDSKVAMILKRLITLVTKKMHPDYKIEFEEKINNYLQILHQTSNHIDTVYHMPKSI